MTDAKQTKCPHCGSTFRISETQLAAKGGSVRCGSCLQVFRADQHLQGDVAAAAKPAAQAGAAKPKNKTGAGGDESWALALLDEKNGKAGASAPSATLDANEWHISKGPAAGADDDGFGFSDNDISDFIATDTSATAPQEKSTPFGDELSEFLDDAGDTDLYSQESEGSQPLNENADESWAKSILSELEHDEKKEGQKKYGMEILDDKTKAPPKNAKLAAAMGLGSRVADEPVPGYKAGKPAVSKAAPTDDFLGEDADILSFLDDDNLSTNSSAPLASNPFSLERPLAHVDAPLTLRPKRESIHWGPLLTWTFLCLTALALFVAQYTYFNFETLAIKPSVRPYFDQACARFGCRLPDIPDPGKLKIDELVVRKHPQAEGALVVDAILRNSASFPQPFPVLRLSFRNTADEVIASRLLKPLEYLQGEARLMRRMPPDTPVRISLDIVDPGKSAVSYSLDPIL